MDSHEGAGSEIMGGEKVTGKDCINPCLDLLLIFENLSRWKAYWLLFWRNSGEQCSAIFGTWATFPLLVPHLLSFWAPSLLWSLWKWSVFPPILFGFQHNVQHMGKNHNYLNVLSLAGTILDALPTLTYLILIKIQWGIYCCMPFSFFRAVMTNYHKVGGWKTTEIYSLVVLEVRSLRSRG